MIRKLLSEIGEFTSIILPLTFQQIVISRRHGVVHKIGDTPYIIFIRISGDTPFA